MRKTISKNGWNLTRDGTKEIWLYNETPEHSRGRVIARFKYSMPGRSCTHFVKFLTENFTPEEYYAEQAKGKAPITILETKGYVSFHRSQSRG